MKTQASRTLTLNQAYWPLRSASHVLGQSKRASKGQSTPKRWLKNFFSMLLAQMEETADPQVWATHDAAGHTLWNAYDSASGRIIRKASETELRVWLENRYQF